MNDSFTISRLAYRILFHALEIFDYDWQQFTEETGISHDFTSNFDEKIPVEEYYQAWHDAARLTGEPLIGLAAGAHMHPGNLGALGYSMMNCATTGDSLRLFFRYEHLGNRSIESHLDVDGDDVIATLHTPFYSPEVVAPMIEMVATSYGRMFHQLTNFAYLDKYNYRSAHFMHKPRGPVEIYEKLLRCPVYFEQDEYRFVFDTGVMHEKVHQADPAVLGALINTISDAVSYKQSDSFSDRVKQHIKQNMPQGLPDAEEVAEALGMSISTLKRRLKAEDMTFRELSQELRVSLAKDLLQANVMSIYEISFMLGFSSSTAFSRAFKTWTGQSPSIYRK